MRRPVRQPANVDRSQLMLQAVLLCAAQTSASVPVF